MLFGLAGREGRMASTTAAKGREPSAGHIKDPTGGRLKDPRI